jgi:hypothetical protein
MCFAPQGIRWFRDTIERHLQSKVKMAAIICHYTPTHAASGGNPPVETPFRPLLVCSSRSYNATFASAAGS